MIRKQQRNEFKYITFEIEREKNVKIAINQINNIIIKYKLGTDDVFESKKIFFLVFLYFHVCLFCFC